MRGLGPPEASSSRTLFPLAGLELKRSGQRRSTYAMRSFIAAGVFAYMVVLWPYLMSPGVAASEMTNRLSQFLLTSARMFQLFAVFAAAPLFTAGLVAEEKQQGTLGQLLLAEFRGKDIFLSKFLAAFLHVELLLVSVLPVMAIASFFGGVSVPEISLQFLIMTCYAFAMCALGLLFSTIAQTPLEALFMTVLAGSLWIGGAGMLDGLLSRFFGLKLAVVGLRTFTPTLWDADWLPGVVIALGIGAVAARLTIRRLPRQIAQPPASVGTRRLQDSPFLDSILPLNASARLMTAAASGLPAHRWPRRRRLFAALALMPLVYISCVGWAALLALIAYDVTSSIGRSREEGSLDVMLLVPESDRFVARALFVAYLRRSLLFLPALAARGLPLLLSWLSPPSGMFPPGYLGYIVASVLSGIALLPVFVALGCLASTWRLSSATQAFAITFGYLAFRQVLYMPLSMFLTPWLGGWLGTMLVVPVRSALITIATIAIGWVAYWLFVRRIGTAWRIGGDVTWHGDWEI